jgi:YbbR domain-containing protein
MAVIGDPELATSITVPIEFKNTPQDLELSSELPERLRLELRGPSGRLTPEYLADTVAVVDLGSVQKPGERTFSIMPANLNLPNGVHLIRPVPSQLRLKLERRASRDVRIVPRYATPPPDGYRIVRTVFEPETLAVVGPESRVKLVDSVETDPIDLTGAVGESTFRVNTYLPDAQVRFVSSAQVTVKVFLEKRPHS